MPAGRSPHKSKIFASATELEGEREAVENARAQGVVEWPPEAELPVGPADATPASIEIPFELANAFEYAVTRRGIPANPAANIDRNVICTPKKTSQKAIRPTFSSR